MTTQKIQKRLDFLTDQIPWLQKKLKEFPDGKLYCERDGHYIKWFIRKGKDNQKKYLPKTQRHLAEQLIQKRYYQAKLSDYLHEIDYLCYSLETIPTLDFETSKLLAENSNYSKLLTETLFSDKKDWSTDFEACAKNPENFLVSKFVPNQKHLLPIHYFLTRFLFDMNVQFKSEIYFSIQILLFSIRRREKFIIGSILV